MRSAAAATGFERFLMQEIDWNERFILIAGQRCAGKPTLLLQHRNRAEKKSIYLSLDDLYFEVNRLIRRNLRQDTGIKNLPGISELNRADILALLRSDTQGVSYLQKPEKIYLDNPNLIHLFSDNRPASGNLRETFFLNQLQVRHNITASRFSDFLVDETWTFEVDGPSQTGEQIRGLPGAHIAADDINKGSGNRIPLWLFGLWLFGFLY